MACVNDMRRVYHDRRDTTHFGGRGDSTTAIKVLKYDEQPLLGVIEDLMDWLGSRTVYLTLDATSVLLDAATDPSSVELSTFVPPRGLNYWSTMPQGHAGIHESIGEQLQQAIARMD